MSDRRYWFLISICLLILAFCIYGMFRANQDSVKRGGPKLYPSRPRIDAGLRTG